MAGKDRKKQLARQRYERQQARRAAQARKARQVRIVGSAVAVALIAGAVGGITVLVNGDDSSDAGASTTPSPAANEPQDGTPKQEISITGVSLKGGSKGTASCTYKESKNDKGAPKDLGTPPKTAEYKGAVDATIKTSQGDIAVELDASKAPCTVNSFAFLAEKKFFDKTKCHRLTTAGGQPGGLSVLQCGDPTASGSGGPGYRYANENTKGAKYSRGVLAMAHSQEPDSNGSQFFIVYADSELPADYTIFGKITSGLDVVDKVAKAGVAAQ